MNEGREKEDDMRKNNLLLFIMRMDVAGINNKPMVQTEEGCYAVESFVQLHSRRPRWKIFFDCGLRPHSHLNLTRKVQLSCCRTTIVVVVWVLAPPCAKTSRFLFQDGQTSQWLRASVLVCKSRQKTGSGGRLSASGITCKGYTEWTQNKKRADAQRWRDSGGLRTHPGASRVYFHSSWDSRAAK